jgi:hypothetical protein
MIKHELNSATTFCSVLTWRECGKEEFWTPRMIPPQPVLKISVGTCVGYSFVIMWIYFVPVPLVYYHVWVLLLWLRLGVWILSLCLFFLSPLCWELARVWSMACLLLCCQHDGRLSFTQKKKGVFFGWKVHSIKQSRHKIWDSLKFI